ncbi:UNVERIFIED_ORG: hypothetical protein M2414_005367 [Rahnella aquatilis]
MTSHSVVSLSLSEYSGNEGATSVNFRTKNGNDLTTLIQYKHPAYQQLVNAVLSAQLSLLSSRKKKVQVIYNFSDLTGVTVEDIS